MLAHTIHKSKTQPQTPLPPGTNQEFKAVAHRNNQKVASSDTQQRAPRAF